MRVSAVLFLSSLLVTASLAVPGCGDEEPKEEETLGDSIKCGPLVCDSVVLGAGYPPIEACCTEDNQCGLDGTRFEQYGAHFSETCQPLNQPGELDPAECDASPPVPTEQFGDLIFPGCCTAAGRCGYMMNSAFGIIQLGLGCVDAAPFLDGGVPTSCTPGPDGGGGAGGGAG